MDAMDLRLAEAATQIAYGAECRICRVTVRIDLAAMARRLGPGTPVRALRERLRCARCGSGEPIVVTLWLGQTQTEAIVGRWE